MSLLTRRAALLGLGAAVSLGPASLALAAGLSDRRFVVVILRGALDGLAALAPYGDPDFAGLRGGLLPQPPGREGGLLDLGGFYGLHPALTGMHAMYAAGQLLPVHAVAGPVRTRSHFEAQDLMESGADHRLSSGWLNRAVQGMTGPATAAPLSVGVSLPLLLRHLDSGLVALRDALGDAWLKTAVLVMTEFGRTVHANGTGGTDHGTAAAAFVAGGAVAGGRVLADWPGLAPAKLLDGRDLQPTLDLRALAKGVLASHLGLNPAALLHAFPRSESA